MSSRRLSDEERAIWAKVQKSANPITGKTTGADASSHTTARPKSVKNGKAALPKNHSAVSDRASNPGNLSSSRDRKLSRGQADPDYTIDLHGLSLDRAWTRLTRTLASAIDHKARVVLVITGKDRGPEVRTDSGARGRIRAKLADWVSASPYADYVSAIRPADRRHGGDGALYLLLKRKK